MEDDEDDPASLAADMWFGAQVSESGAARAEDEEYDAASVAAEMWFQDESRSDAQHEDKEQTIGADISHAGHSNTDANSSVPPKIYTPAVVQNEWLKDDADGEHEVDVTMEDLHLVD